MSDSLAIPRAPLALALLALVSRIRRRAKALALRAVPNWPPAPKVLLRKGGLAVVLGLLLLWLTRGPTKDVLEDDGMRDWVTKEREKRRKKLLDLLAQLPLRRLQRLVPLPELEEKLKEEGEKKDEQIEEVEEPLKFPITAESVADAAEDLAKAESSAPAARLGFAVAGALSACELQMLARKAARAPEEAQAAECDALQQRLRELQDFAETVALRCERSFARRLGRSFGAAAKEAEALVRQRRLAQWRCVAALLWRFKGTLPFMGLASLLSMVLGAFSAIRFHYQAAVINLAKDAVTGSKASSSIEETVGAMLVSEAIVQLADFARARLTLLGKSKVVQELKVALFAALLRQDLDYLEQCDLWQLRATIGSTGTIVSQVVDFPAILVEALARLLAAVLALGRQNGRLAAFLGVMLPLRLLLSQLLQHLENQLQRNGLPDFKGQINSCWSCLVRPAALRTMRAFAREPTELAAFARFLRVQDELQQRSTLVFRMMQPAQVLLEHMLEIGTLWYGGRLALRGEMAFGELSSAVLVASGAFEGARYAQCAAANVSQQALGPMAQMAQLLGRTPRIGLEEPPLASMPDVNAMRWDLEFREVHFSYHRGAAVLRGLSFKLRQGEFLGILGTTGSGKSTVLSLILRLYEPQSGQILLDGRDIKEYNPLWLRRHMGFVSQDLVLCNRTVRENLFYGCEEEPSEAEAREALRVAQCEETFFNPAAFPKLWHTDVGDSGSDLSGGERQRLALARAVVKKPRLLILDEATSALDEISQAKLQEEVEALRRKEGMTMICVAHRLSNLARADRLLVMQEGRVVEEGTPAALLQSGGVFAEYAQAHRACLED